MMKNSKIKVSLLMFFSVILVTACASMFMQGGSLAPAGYRANILVNYDAKGTVPPGVTYHLVKTDKGEAIFERSPDGSGALFETHWTDKDGDHFAGWVATSHGYEFVVPKDRKKPAKKYVYPSGYYELKERDGITRPIPTAAIDPVATLIPK
jgi:hypothetical protein